MFQTRIAGTGSYLPEKTLTNHDLEKLVDTNHDWIMERTGIESRHIAAPNQATSDLAYVAATRAMEAAGCTADDIDFILFATVSPDQRMPSTACYLQSKLGCKPIPAIDISAACSGFLYGMTLAHNMIQGGVYKKILVVGAEVLSRLVDYTDRNTCILFGDGAGAMILERAEESSSSKIYSYSLAADGNLADLLELPVGGSKKPFTEGCIEDKSIYMKMNGKEIFKNAVRTMNISCQKVLEQNNMQEKDIAWLVPHQANGRIIEAVAKYFGMPTNKVIMNVHKTGNTSAATVPIAFDEAVRDGRIQRGQNILLTAFGAGLTSGSILLRY
ncbi:MAG: ketoacyl-ACP synthase III [Bdellovibrionales bacterium]|nr:ketoacyl-ACP synthase III [Bdellovibrionales bacterium]